MKFRNRTPLAWYNLVRNWRRLAVALCGIGFAVVLMFAQTGFKNSLPDSTVKVLREIDGELLIASKACDTLVSMQTFDRDRIYQARGCPGVQGVYPLYIEYNCIWRAAGKKGHPIRLLAFDMRDPVFKLPEVSAQAAALAAPNTALYDRKSKSKKYHVPDDPQALVHLRGAELGGVAIRLVGTYAMGTDFISDGTLILSDRSLVSRCPHRVPGGDPLSVVDLGVVKLKDPAKALEVKACLADMLPDDVTVHTTEEFIEQESTFWNNSTGIGFIFFLGTIIGFLVGVIICYQIISADITDHLAEFATLKAMGYRDAYFAAFVFQESLYLSVLSFLPGLLVSRVLYLWLEWKTGLLMNLGFWHAGGVFVLTVAMCVLSGALAMRKVTAADPAELF